MTLEKEIHQIKPFRNMYHNAYVNLIYTGKWILQFTSELLRQYNLTPQQYNVLRILRGKYPEAATVIYVRERMLDRMSDASRIIELLRVKGFVERNICADNRRKMDVLITQKGLLLLEEIDSRNNRVMDNKLSTLNEMEVSHLIHLLDKLRDNDS